jgi:hypothetical protein
MFFTVLAALALVAGGCGDDDDDEAGGEDGDAPPVYTIKATDAGEGQATFTVPSDMTGGVITIRLQNDGRNPHDFQLAEAVPGHTLQELLAQVSSEEAPLEEWVVAAGGVGATAPGQANEATLDLEPGTYWYFSTESSGEGEESVPDAAAGMAGELTLTGDSGAEFPDTSAEIGAKDYSFDLDGLEEGDNSIEFSNEGKQLHHALLVPVAAGKTFEDAKNALLSEEEPEGPPPVDFEKAVATPVVNPGTRMVANIPLTKGTYVVVCFLPDKGTAGPPHAAKGMISELQVG